jgi:glycine/D-amino acid oxidase-like deaminating enzyme
VNGPLWVDPEERTFPVLGGDIEVDIAIVGAGFSGLGAAWALKHEDASVLVVEGRTVASGASGRNAGFVLAGPAQRFGDAVRSVGIDETLAIWELTRRNHRTLVDIMQDLQIECGYLRRGSMSLAADEDEWLDALSDVEDMQAAGIDVCRVEARSLPLPFDRMYCGGVYFSGNAEIEPGRFLRKLAQHLSECVLFREQTRVQALHWEGRWKLRTAAGTVTAARVVLATNAYTPALLPFPIAPTRGQVLATRPVDRVIVPFPMYANRGFQYWRQTASGRLVLGGWRDLDPVTEVGEEERLHALIHEALDRFAGEVHACHGLDPQVEHRWAGIMGFTPDHMPLVGAIPGTDGAAIAAGYSGHGVAMAFFCGMLAGRTVLGEPAAIPAPFNPGRFM